MKLEERRYGVLDCLRIPFQCAPLWTVLRVLIVLLFRVGSTLQILVTAAFIDRALLVVAGEADAWAIAFPIAALGALIAWRIVSEALRRSVVTKLDNAVRLRFRSAITQKRAALPYALIEDNDTWNLIGRVSRDPEQSIAMGMSSLAGLIGISIQVAGLLGILLASVWWTALALTAIGVPMALLAVRSGRAQYEAEREVSELKRRHEYLSEVLMSREAADERALFSAARLLAPRWKELFETARKRKLHVQIRWYVKSKTGGLVMALFTAIIAAVLIQPVSTGALTLGLFIALVQASATLVSVMTWELSHNIDNFTQAVEYFKDVEAFSRLPEVDGALLPPAPPEPFESLEFENVTFRYPGTDRDVLKEMSFRIEAGTRCALVGINGAGKTTLTKLITGLYTNYMGRILLNGREIRAWEQTALKGMTSVLFQDFAQYAMTLRDNIAVGDINALGDADIDDRVRAAAGLIGLDALIESLPEGMNTALGKIDEKGQDVSGGQWQRIAMARATLSPAPLRILDEPTAALDPVSESNLYGEFNRISAGHTTILVSHRLGFARLADEILVIDGGRVAECGTHAKLLADGGLYADMYESQRGWYQ